MFSRDPYKKLHRRRRRNSRQYLAPIFAVLIVGAAAWAATQYRPQHQPVALSTVSSASPSVALLTARDAVTAARTLAVPQSDTPSAEAKLAKPTTPTTWAPGREVTLDGKLQKNQSIGAAFSKRGVSEGAIARFVAGIQRKFDFHKCRPGDAWEIDVAKDGNITRFRYQSSPTEVIEAVKKGNAFEVHGVEVPVEKKRGAVTGSIDSSLWQSFERTDAGGQLAAQYVDVFAYTIDFATETQVGDKFGAVYESAWLDGKQLTSGKLLAAAYEGEAGTHYAYRWKDAYYTEDGESVERQFLRSPLATVRVTSRYGRRFHPVLQKMKMHAGVDYGAPIGTPVQAVANGKVVYAGWKGANGKLVAIQHANGYTTYYAHLSQIGKDIRPGVRVKKKQFIGKVGNTGRSTGPHLHFGMKRNGAYINPLTVDFQRGEPLRGKEREQFKQEAVAAYKAMLASEASAIRLPTHVASFR